MSSLHQLSKAIRDIRRKDLRPDRLSKPGESSEKVRHSLRVIRICEAHTDVVQRDEKARCVGSRDGRVDGTRDLCGTVDRFRAEGDEGGVRAGFEEVEELGHDFGVVLAEVEAWDVSGEGRKERGRERDARR